MSKARQSSAETLIQTRVPADVGAAIAFVAYDDGDTVAGWLRRLVVREVNLVRIRAWVVSARRANPIQVFGAEPSHYQLRPRRDITPLDRVFVLADRIDRPIPTETLIQEDWYKKPHQFRFVLERSPAPWQIVTLIGNEITLHANVHLLADSRGKDSNEF